jgi:3'-5' exoribonuclease
MSGNASVATLRADQALDAVFACTAKQRLISRAGDPYLAIELRDSSGTIKARAFRDADLLAGRFERGDLVRVTGRVERFRDELTVAVEGIERVSGAGEEAERFLPRSRRDLDELEGFLEHLVREVYDPGLRGLLESLLADRELRAQLRRAPCSLPSAGSARPGVAGVAGPRAGGGHHAFLGGLLEHTVAVATLAVELCAVHPRLDRDLLLCAAIVHDIGKTREYTYGAEIGQSEEGRLLGHVELGLRLIVAHAPAALSSQRRLALEHCVIAHHGGEGHARFASPEALALHRLNALDGSVKGAFERGL